jgi:hypothetical protein
VVKYIQQFQLILFTLISRLHLDDNICYFKNSYTVTYITTVSPYFQLPYFSNNQQPTKTEARLCTTYILCFCVHLSICKSAVSKSPNLSANQVSHHSVIWVTLVSNKQKASKCWGWCFNGFAEVTRKSDVPLESRFDCYFSSAWCFPQTRVFSKLKFIGVTKRQCLVTELLVSMASCRRCRWDRVAPSSLNFLIRILISISDILRS